jgi:succinate dehydrogenase/fumarate reductase flavoprotein subunit
VIKMQKIQNEMGIADKSRENNQNLIDFLEFQNALLLAPMIISAAITRDESRGAHYKVGFEQADETFKKHIVLYSGKEETCR